MEYNAFFPPHEGLRLQDIAARLGAELSDQAFADRMVRSIAPVSRAKQDQLCYILSRRTRDELLTCDAAAVICDESLKSIVPGHIPALICKNPHTIFAQAGELLHPSAMRPSAVAEGTSVSASAHVDPTASLEPGVIVEPFAVIGAHVQIGAGTRIGPGAII